MAHDVFISHSSKDKTAADAICVFLEGRGIGCWVAPRDIRPGAKWGSSIIQAIRQSRVMILIFSSHANTSPQINREVERAVHFGVAVIPMRIEDVMPEGDLEYFLGVPHWLDAFGAPLESHLEALAKGVNDILAQPVAPTPAGTEGEADGDEIHLDSPEEAKPLPRSEGGPFPRSRLPWLVGVGVALVVLIGGGLGYYFGVAVPADQARQTEIAKQEEVQRESAAKDKAATDAAEKARLEAEAQKAATAAQALHSQQEAAERLAAARGGLMVRTDPEGATVTLGGEDAQTSPATFKDEKLGSYPIHIVLDGYDPVDQTAEIAENRFTDLGTIALVRSKGAIQIKTDLAGLDYSIGQNGNVINSGKSPATVPDLLTGTYAISVRKGDWEINDTVAVKRNETTTYVPEFITGSVTITSDPAGASVTQGDKSLGQTPLTLSDVRSGNRSYLLKLAGYQDAPVNVNVQGNKQAQLSVVLEKNKFPTGTWAEDARSNQTIATGAQLAETAHQEIAIDVTGAVTNSIKVSFTTDTQFPGTTDPALAGLSSYNYTRRYTGRVVAFEGDRLTVRWDNEYQIVSKDPKNLSDEVIRNNTPALDATTTFSLRGDDLSGDLKKQ